MIIRNERSNTLKAAIGLEKRYLHTNPLSIKNGQNYCISHLRNAIQFLTMTLRNKNRKSPIAWRRHGADKYSSCKLWMWVFTYIKAS